MSIHPDDGVDVQRVNQLTGGIGADGVIITAASKSSAIVSAAFNMCRRKGRVVLVGDVGLDIKRGDLYSKELDFLISTSYGPGRYDAQYEEKGLEYPVAYVRWTENRNLQEILSLIENKKLNIADLVSNVYTIDNATAAYEELKNASVKPLMVLLQYPANEEKTANFIQINTATCNSKNDCINVAVIGAGGFAKGMHLPNLEKLKNKYQVYAIMSRTAHNADAVAKLYNAAYSTTSYEKILSDENVDMVLITTRHNLHAQMVLQALKAGKHVLVEKPLAINEDELSQIESFYKENTDAPLLLTGFNRRHSQYLQEINNHTSKRINPMIINYRMNAGYIPLDCWVHTEEGAGRNIGEACHIYDLFNYLTGARAVSVSAHSINPSNSYASSKDNFVATISYEDGSVANLIYTALGSKDVPKEQMDIYFDNKIISLTDYQKLTGHGVKINTIETKISEKGQLEEIEAFADAIKSGLAESPIPLWQQLQAMEISFAVEKQI